jgi:hypothetical protein
MATQKEEKEEQEFFADKIKEQAKMEKNTKQHEPKHEEMERDHLGQGVNPAIALEKKNVEEAQKRAEKKEKEEAAKSK